MVAQMKVLMIEDVSTDALLLEREVRKIYPQTEFLCVETEQDYRKALDGFGPQLILSDFKLPSFDGLSALSIARTLAPDVPFIIVTGSMNEDTAVDCLKAGAWDYVIKEHLKRIGPAIEGALKKQRILFESRQAELALRESEERYRNIFEVAPIGIAIHAGGQIVMVNPAGVRLLGATSDQELVGKPITTVVHPSRMEKAKDRIRRLLMGEKGLYPVDDVYVRMDGSPLEVEVMASVLNYQGTPAVQVIVKDITERKKAEAELRYISQHDYLTGLGNRRHVEDQMVRLDRTSFLPISIIMGDMNGLKMVNDSFGHRVGDNLIRKAAELINNICRPQDIVCRTGGDEFIVLLPNTDEEQAERVVTNLRKNTFEVKVGNALMSVSFGCATRTSKQKSMQELLTEAENRMYDSKMYESASLRSKAIDVIMSALFEKSHRELLHSQRVSVLCESMAIAAGFTQDKVNRIRICGLVHDIGKIGISEEILNKPGRLDDDEWLIMREHPEVGRRILKSVNEFSELAEFVYCHHERWDGKGYPRGIAGEAIPFESRIIALADAYDAMTMDRPYRKRLLETDARGELQRCSGSQFDPRIVELFLGVDPGFLESKY